MRAARKMESPPPTPETKTISNYVTLRDKIRQELQSFIELGQDLSFLRQKYQDLTARAFEEWTIDENGKGVRSFTQLVKRDFGFTERHATRLISESTVASYLKDRNLTVPISGAPIIPLLTMRAPGKRGTKRPLNLPRIAEVWKKACDFAKTEGLSQPTDAITKKAKASLQTQAEIKSGKLDPEKLAKEADKADKQLADAMKKAPAGTMKPEEQEKFLLWFAQIWRQHTGNMKEEDSMLRGALATIYLIQLYPNIKRLVEQKPAVVSEAPPKKKVVKRSTK